MPGLSRTVRPLSEAGVLLDCSATIRSRSSPGMFEWSPKLGCSRTIWLISEVGLSFTPETAQGLSTKAKTYLINNYNTNIWKDKLSPHTHTPIRAQTDFPHTNSSGATVKARVTKDNARDPSRNSRAFVTTLGDLFSYRLYNGGEVSHATYVQRVYCFNMYVQSLIIIEMHGLNYVIVIDKNISNAWNRPSLYFSECAERWSHEIGPVYILVSVQKGGRMKSAQFIFEWVCRKVVAWNRPSLYFSECAERWSHEIGPVYILVSVQKGGRMKSAQFIF